MQISTYRFPRIRKLANPRTGVEPHDKISRKLRALSVFRGPGISTGVEINMLYKRSEGSWRTERSGGLQWDYWRSHTCIEGVIWFPNLGLLIRVCLVGHYEISPPHSAAVTYCSAGIFPKVGCFGADRGEREKPHYQFQRKTGETASLGRIWAGIACDSLAGL